MRQNKMEDFIKRLVVLGLTERHFAAIETSKTSEMEIYCLEDEQKKNIYPKIEPPLFWACSIAPPVEQEVTQLEFFSKKFLIFE